MSGLTLRARGWTPSCRGCWGGLTLSLQSLLRVSVVAYDEMLCLILWYWLSYSLVLYQGTLDHSIVGDNLDYTDNSHNTNARNTFLVTWEYSFYLQSLLRVSVFAYDEMFCLILWYWLSYSLVLYQRTLDPSIVGDNLDHTDNSHNTNQSLASLCYPVRSPRALMCPPTRH